jgi:hypothetical protein
MRNGKFSSSQIGDLFTNGRAAGSYGLPFYGYIEQKKNERRAGRSLSNDVRSPATDWGNMCEPIAFSEIADFEYQLISQKDRYIHPVYPLTGVPDYLVKSKSIVGDIKCPYTLDSYFDLLKINSLESFRKIKPMYFWQLVSNAILTKMKYAEITVFMPTKAMILVIQSVSAESENHEDPFKRYYFHKKGINEMPWTVDMPTIYKFCFEVTNEIKDEFNTRLEIATKLLNE